MGELHVRVLTEIISERLPTRVGDRMKLSQLSCNYRHRLTLHRSKETQ
jgi:hypothetical protein